jgi:toxin ParE1/3/4
MSRPVIVMPRARLQLKITLDYLNSRSPSAARNLAQRFHRAYRQLADFPLSGPAGSVPGTRRLVVAPYVLTYRDTRAGIEILDIRHGRQREMPLADQP